MWSISILSGSWTMWPWWQAWDLSKGCPEGQSGSSSCYNILHAKSLLSPLSWTVNDHGHYKPLVLRNPGKEQPKKKKKKILSCKHVLLLMKKEAQVGPKAQRAEPGGWKLISRSWNQWRNFICPAGFDLLQTKSNLLPTAFSALECLYVPFPPYLLGTGNLCL